MREIKFRGKRIDNGEWAYGYYAVHRMMITGEMDYFIIVDEQRPQSIDPKTVGQYTGLKDKNSVEIYESDIVKQIYHAETGGSYEDGMSFDGHHLGQVVITARKGVCMRNPYCYSMETDETIISNQYKTVAGYRCEVIGNIHENKELLEVVSND